MALKKVFIAIFIVFISCKTPTDPIFTVLDVLMENNGLKSSLQIRTCLKQTNQQQRKLLLEQFITIGKGASSGLLPKFPILFLNSLTKIMGDTTSTCLKNTNDLKMLLKKYNTTISSISKTFQTFSRLNFLKVHYYFTNISQIYTSTQPSLQKYEKIAEIINDMSFNVFNDGSRQITEDPWLLTAFAVEAMDQYYGISVSNGIIGVVSSSKPFTLSSSVLAGAYDKLGRGRVDNLIETFSALNIQLSYGSSSKYYNYYQQLNMKQGSMLHSFSSESCSVSYKYYTLRNLPHIFFTQFQITVHQDGLLQIKNVHDAPDQLVGITKSFENIDTSKKLYSILETSAKTSTGKIQLAIASSFRGLDGEFIMHEDWDLNVHLMKIKKSLKKGDILKFGLITCLISSQHHSDPVNEAIRLTIRASSIQDLTQRHKQKWANLWKSDIIIEGNDQDQKYVRSMLYHCYSFISQGKSYGVSPMGLSGLGYNGHVFWDMDLWIYPALLALQPSLAKNLIQYRIERLEAARNNAFLNGYLGAMYPWQSSKLGDEQTPVWAMSGPLQHHISGCVSFGVWNYYLVTKDKVWLRQKGYDVIQSVAQFFQSRVQMDSLGNYHINNVVASDQWAENVNDDAFTNGVAKKSFQIANKASVILNYTQNQRWSEIEKKIVILQMDDNITKEHSQYYGQNIKQADVNLLAFPLKILNQPGQVSRDLKFYEVRVPVAGTPAMTYSIFTILYSRLKDSSNAYKQFKGSFEQYLKKPFNVFSETKGGTNPYFLTGAGGVLQSLVFGFGGLDITDNGLQTIKTAIPKQWRKVTIIREKSIVNLNQHVIQVE